MRLLKQMQPRYLHQINQPVYLLQRADFQARLLQQSTGQKAVPLSVLVAAGMLVTTQKTFSNPEPGFSDRSSWYIQLIAGRKFSDRFSLQLSPIFLYSNTPFNSKGDKSQFAPGIGARYKINKRLALTIDYHHPVMDMDSAFSNPLSVGLDIETGGHVFQLHFSNAAGMNERAYINETTGDFFKGDILQRSLVFLLRREN